ncbi:uncharacterized protein LOC141697493 [Apium graveolens]|uniref:uncharacterized protein LOC141697493 n=1 Tax=Apium graveolens TaxID=4045 RepID=UPI003D7984E2
MAASSSTTQTTYDVSSIYYINPSDASTMQLVSVKFNGTNYNNWKRSILLILTAKNKLGLVNGTLTISDITATDYTAWERSNSLVISWILYNIDETIAKSVFYLKTARAIWKDLEERFGRSSITELFSLEQQLMEISQCNQSVSDFYTQIKTIWDAIDDVNLFPTCACTTCVCDLVVRGHILLMVHLPTVSQAYGLIAQKESHRDLSQSSSNNENMAFVADRRNYSQNQNQKPYGYQHSSQPYQYGYQHSSQHYQSS